MKKFIIAVSIIVFTALSFDAMYYRLGWFIDLHPNEPVTTFVKTEGTKIMLDRGDGYEEFEVRGVNMGSGIPGEWSTDFAIDKKTYLRWFGQIKEMGANCVRIYTVQNENFYEAFYEYNKDNPDPLYLIHGVWVNDYVQNSRMDAYDDEFCNTFLDDCKTVVDVIHGTKKLSAGEMDSAGSGTFRRDVSEWVIGYILGVEWEDVTVAFTDHIYLKDENRRQYKGKYMYTHEDASAFECMLTKVGDKVIEYVSTKNKQQRLVAFSNWPTTDPF